MCVRAPTSITRLRGLVRKVMVYKVMAHKQPQKKGPWGGLFFVDTTKEPKLQLGGACGFAEPLGTPGTPCFSKAKWKRKAFQLSTSVFPTVGDPTVSNPAVPCFPSYFFLVLLQNCCTVFVVWFLVLLLFGSMVNDTKPDCFV